MFNDHHYFIKICVKLFVYSNKGRIFNKQLKRLTIWLKFIGVVQDEITKCNCETVTGD